MHWQFVLQPCGSWTWRRLAADGSTEETSPLYEDYGRAVTAAVENGFQPKAHRWTVHTGRSVTQYAPGCTPVKSDLQGNVIRLPIKSVLNPQVVLAAAPASLSPSVDRLARGRAPKRKS